MCDNTPGALEKFKNDRNRYKEARDELDVRKITLSAYT